MRPELIRGSLLPVEPFGARRNFNEEGVQEEEAEEEVRLSKKHLDQLSQDGSEWSNDDKSGRSVMEEGDIVSRRGSTQRRSILILPGAEGSGSGSPKGKRVGIMSMGEIADSQKGKRLLSPISPRKQLKKLSRQNTRLIYNGCVPTPHPTSQHCLPC